MAKMAARPRVAVFEAVGAIFVAAAVEIDHEHWRHGIRNGECRTR
jgi:hypothetical protein